MAGKSYITRRKPYSFEVLKKALHKIKWGVQGIGCDHWAIVNHKGAHTELQVVFPNSDARIESGSHGKLFGRSICGKNGDIYFPLKTTWIEVHYDKGAANCVSIYPRGCPKPPFINLYNHECK